MKAIYTATLALVVCSFVHVGAAEPAATDDAVLMDFVAKSNGKIHALELLPDFGSSPAKRVGGAVAQPMFGRSYQRAKADMALPDSLVTTLGKAVRLGDLEVTPQKVERKRVVFKFPNAKFKPELSEHEALVLHVQLKNLSKDTEFRPTDRAFDHLWKDGMHPAAAMPYTYLELPNGKRFCGPFKWIPVKKPVANLADGEFVEGQEDKVLKPDEQIKTVILTDPGDRVPEAPKHEKDKLLWRVQFRRGLVVVKDRDISATGVIGVRFEVGQIEAKVDQQRSP
jgi:hypothetical protein